MSRTRLFVPPAQISAPTITVTGPDHRHLARVLRVREGDAVTLFDGAGSEVAARVARVGRHATELVPENQPAIAAGGAFPPVVLLVAVPRGGRMDLLVQKTCELGVARIVPILAARSVARPEPGRRARWQKIAQEAARQCGRADVPAVEEPVALDAALARTDLPPLRLALWEGERGQSLGAAVAGASLPAAVALLVGPEGGFAPGEIDAARAAGFVPVSLGTRILRVETAAIAAVVLAQAANGALD